MAPCALPDYGRCFDCGFGIHISQRLICLPHQRADAEEVATVKTERDHKEVPITRSITREIQIAFRDIGASAEEVGSRDFAFSVYCSRLC